MLNELENRILEEMIVFKSKNPKIRIGGAQDGGYVVVSGYEYDCYLSCGIGDSVSFDNQFVNIYPNCQKYIGFDGTCNRPYNLDSRVEFVKKNIGTDNSELLTDLKNESMDYKDIFLKMDIEGHEWNWIKTFKDLSKFKQIVFEFHGLFDEDCPTGGWNQNVMVKDFGTGFFDPHTILEDLKILNKTHYLVHIHGNNAGVVKHYDGSFSDSKGYDEWMTVGELTFIRKDCEILGLNTQKLPIEGLDFPNYRHIPDVYINKWPFVKIQEDETIN
jgi:hypothetical protein